MPTLKLAMDTPLIIVRSEEPMPSDHCGVLTLLEGNDAVPRLIEPDHELRLSAVQSVSAFCPSLVQLVFEEGVRANASVIPCRMMNLRCILSPPDCALVLLYSALKGVGEKVKDAAAKIKDAVVDD